MFDLLDINRTNNGITATVSNQIIALNGTATANAFIRLDRNASSYYFNLKKGTYTLSANNSIALSSSDFLRFVTSTGVAIAGLSLPLDLKNSSRTFTINEDLENIQLQVRISSGTTLNNFIIKPQLEKGSTSTPYTPHKEQVLPLTLGNIELCKIGDYQDYFYKDSNKWYLHKEIGKVVYDGTETGESHYWYVQDENNHSYQITDNTIHLKESKKGICNCFIINNSGASPYLYPILQAGTSYCRFVTYNITGTISTLEEWKRWLSSNNIVFYYPLATPTDTEITDTTLISQLEAINNAISYEEQTNISDNQIALFNVEAYQSTKLVLKEMATAIVALGGV